MPQPFGSGDELSLRHLPDVSDSSFSFQIPGAVRGDNLLADDDMDFFKGTDVSVAPLASPPTTGPLFTLNQLTPKSEVEKLPSSKDGKKLGSFPTLSYDHNEDHDTNPKQVEANPHQPRKNTINVNVLSKPKSKVITTSGAAAQLPPCEGSPAAVRLGNIRAELNSYNDDLLVGPSREVKHQELTLRFRHKPQGILRQSLEKKQPQRISPRNNQKVVESGISKTRCTTTTTTKFSSITSCHHDGDDALPIQQEQNTTTAESSRILSQQTEQNGDVSFADSSMSSAAEGVAGRLVMYSQKLINSFGLFNSENSSESNRAREVFVSQDPESVTNANVVHLQVPHEADRPLTLSQLSPQKPCDGTPTPPHDVPSPLRLPTKRPVSVASDVLQKRKKSKTDTSSADIPVSKLNAVPKARLPATKRHPKPISSNSNSELRLHDRSTKRKPTLSRVNGPGIKRPPVFKPEESELNDGGDNNTKDTRAAISASSSRCTTSASTSRSNDAEPVNSITSNHKGKSVASSSQGSSRAAHHAPQPATRPVPFKFQTDKRGAYDHKDINRSQDTNDGSEASESRKEKRPHSSTIPDFKAMHAAQEAELALRKENIQPVVPLPIRWETDHRLKERQKFDEMIREKEREQERLLDLIRKEREEQEEREVRELRKKTVPKAHEVPEWYKEAPKKKKIMVDSIGRLGGVSG